VSTALQIRRRLYEDLRRTRFRGRALRRQIAMIEARPAGPGRGPDDGGTAGVREPRRPAPSQPPQRFSAPPPPC